MALMLFVTNWEITIQWAVLAVGMRAITHVGVRQTQGTVFW
jgi:hypothetical protein